MHKYAHTGAYSRTREPGPARRAAPAQPGATSRPATTRSDPPPTRRRAHTAAANHRCKVKLSTGTHNTLARAPRAATMVGEQVVGAADGGGGGGRDAGLRADAVGELCGASEGAQRNTE